MMFPFSALSVPNEENDLLKKNCGKRGGWKLAISGETIMAQIIHCFMLLYLVFIIAEIRNVLMGTDPHPSRPVTIWEEVQPPAGGLGNTFIIPR